jgi:tetratricopeptide (TPR) repeat protein
MPLSLLLLPLIAQASALNGPSVGNTMGLPLIDRPADARPRHHGVVFDFPTPPSHLKSCLDTADRDPVAGAQAARDWLRNVAKDGALSATAEPQLCLGAALIVAEDWVGAEQAFTTGRNAAAASDLVLRGQLAGMAGNAALAQGAADRALPMLDMGHADALAAGNSGLAGGIAIDRARALVALKRPAEAATALAEARTALPNDAQGWLLSATLSRRMNALPEAQRQIETAAQLAPADPEIGLEAGVIAMLSGREDAARKSWASVTKTAPDTDAGKRAAAYLAQIGPETTKTATPAPVTKR